MLSCPARNGVWHLGAWTLTAFALMYSGIGGQAAPGQESRRIQVLFLGDRGHHKPAERAAQLLAVLAERGIDLTYTERLDWLNPNTLGRYDCLVIYANQTEISPEQERSLLDFVASGKGFVPIHCASYCFLNSPKYIELVGAQFKSHGTGMVRAKIIEPDHPALRGVDEFESWDETYVHHQHNTDRIVLMERVESSTREPWTWVRSYGKGRVFYTASGHDERTWSNPNFQKLIEQGIRWASGDWALEPRWELKPFDYVEANVPNYVAGARWGTLGEPIGKMQLPVEPAESMKHLVVPPGFKVELFAAEPDITKPIAMTWDERGRLWILESVDYPNEKLADGQGHDRIKICEDTDGDGRADKFTVFAERLSIPTSIVRARGGVIVSQAPDMLFLKDTDGDDKADVRQVLFSGWGIEDTHAGPSNLRWGFDNWIWGSVGYSGFRGTVGGQRHQFRQGFFRFKPDGSELEFLGSTSNNTWGLAFSEDGHVFGSTANGAHSVYLPIPNRYYESVRGWHAGQVPVIADHTKFHPITDKVRQVDWHGGYTAAAGHSLYTARSFPQEYWNRVAFVAEPTGHLLHQCILESQGAGFVSRDGWNLLASDDEWTSPIVAEVGPDGALWVVDWYNFIVQHNPTPAGFQTGKGNAYETPLRDKKHGRVYRIIYEGAQLFASSSSSVGGAKSSVPTRVGATPSSSSDSSEGRARQSATSNEAEPLSRPVQGGSRGGPRAVVGVPAKLDNATPEQLVAALANDNMFWRMTAQRLLVERGKKDVVRALAQLAGDTRVDAIGLNAGAIHALWTMHGLGALDSSDSAATAVSALEHPSMGVRRTALKVLPRTTQSLEAVLSAKLLDDPEPAVRIQAFLALGEMPASEPAGAAVSRALSESQNASDPWISTAATSAAARNDRSFLLAAAALKLTDKTERAITGAVRVVAEHYARGAPEQSVGSLITVLREAQPPIAEAACAGLAAGWPADRAPELNDRIETDLVALISKVSAAPTRRSPPPEGGARGDRRGGPNSPSGQMAVVSLARRWGVGGKLEAATARIRQELLEQVADAKQPEAPRLAAAQQLVAVGIDDSSFVPLLDLVTPQASPTLATGLLEALSGSSSDAVGSAVLERWGTLTPASRRAALALLMRRPAWTQVLLEAIEKGSIDQTDLDNEQVAQLSRHPDKSIAERATKLLGRGGRLPSPDRQKVLDELLPLAEQPGDAAAGKIVFEKNCAKCHRLGGLGDQVGPDLTGIAARKRAEILTDVLDPNRSVEGNYRQYMVATKDGRVLSGLLKSETKTSIELLDSDAKRHVLLRDDIDELVSSPRSLMPEGFEKLEPQEISSLLEFLAARGRFFPLPIGPVATAVSTRGMFYDRNADAERLIFDTWGPATAFGVPFYVIDPQGDSVKNVILLQGPQGAMSRQMPKSVSVPCNAPAKIIHLLSGVSGWGYPYSEKGSVSMIVRLHYADGQTEDHPLLNGVHFADYIRVVDVPESKLAFKLRNQQLRYLSITPQRTETIESIEFAKGEDRTAPLVMAVTVEGME